MNLNDILKEYKRIIKDLNKITDSTQKLLESYFVAKSKDFDKKEVIFIVQKCFEPKYKLKQIIIDKDNDIKFTVYIEFETIREHTIKFNVILNQNNPIDDILDDAFEQ